MTRRTDAGGTALRAMRHRNKINGASPDFPLPPDLRWFPAAEEMRATPYEKLAVSSPGNDGAEYLVVSARLECPKKDSGLGCLRPHRGA